MNAASTADPTLLTGLGVAYLLLLGHLTLCVGLYVGSRTAFVITPNLAARHYGLHVVVVLLSLMLATVLEHALLPAGTAALQREALPHLALLLIAHLFIYYRQDPWLIAFGAAAVVSLGVVALGALTLGVEVHLAQWIALALLYALVIKLWLGSVSTKRAFRRAASIYVDTKEDGDARMAPQRPWLGLSQWLALIAASATLAVLNSLLRGHVVGDIPALEVLVEAVFLLGVTAMVCAVPAATYWFAHRHWMPELTRFAWLVWIVVGFAFTYGNYLTGLDRA